MYFFKNMTNILGAKWPGAKSEGAKVPYRYISMVKHSKVTIVDFCLLSQQKHLNIIIWSINSKSEL